MFITCYFKNGINRSVDRFFWWGQNFSKKYILFFPYYVIRSSHRNVLYEMAVLHLLSKTLKNTFYRFLYSNTSFVTFETNQGVIKLKKHQEQLNWHLLFTTPIHQRSVMLMSYVIQSCNIRTIRLTFASFCHKVFE